jgi:hypothetical protein
MTTPFDTKDPRYHGTIVSNGTFFRTAVITGQRGVIYNNTIYNGPGGNGGYSLYFSLATKSFTPAPPAPPFVIGTGNSDTGSNPYFKKKWIDPVTDVSLLKDYTSRTSWMDLRYGEVLMDYAEASFELGHPATEAMGAVNLLRARAGMPLYTTIDQAKIRHERMVEFAYENKTWWDYIRWRSFGTDFTNRQQYGLQCYWDVDTNDYVYIRVQNGGLRNLDKKGYYNDFLPADISSDPLLRPSGHNPYY